MAAQTLAIKPIPRYSPAMSDTEVRPPDTYTDPAAYVAYFHGEESPAYRSAMAGGIQKARNWKTKPVEVRVYEKDGKMLHAGFAGGKQVWGDPW